jgi:hypothetical protein
MKINHFRLFESIFSSAHMCFSMVGHSGQNHKMADLSLKINFFQFFRSRFGFFVQFYLYPELEIKKYAQGQELLIFGVFLKYISPHGDAILKKLKIWLNACNILLLLLYLNGVIFSVNLKFNGKILA